MIGPGWSFPGSGFRIHRAAEHDIDSLAARLAGLPLMERYGRTQTDLSRSLAGACDPGGGVELYWAEDTETNQPAGLVWYSVAGTFLMGGYLKLLAVFDEYRGRGLGRRLLQHAEARVRRASDFFFLLVTSDNERAIRFYENAGYVFAGKLERLVLQDADELLYWKRIKEGEGPR